MRKQSHSPLEKPLTKEEKQIIRDIAMRISPSFYDFPERLINFYSSKPYSRWRLWTETPLTKKYLEFYGDYPDDSALIRELSADASLEPLYNLRVLMLLWFAEVG